MSEKPLLLYCHCAYMNVIPEDTKKEVLKYLSSKGIPFEPVPDLCGLAGRKDPELRRFSESSSLIVAACYPRTVKWLFHAAGMPLPGTGIKFINMREQDPEEIIESLSRENLSGDKNADNIQEFELDEKKLSGKSGVGSDSGSDEWIPWFPLIDYKLCKNCKQCLNFCLFDVFSLSEDDKILVKNPENCKTNCPACARVCPAEAIIFPKYKAGVLSGAEASEVSCSCSCSSSSPLEDLLKGNVYSFLRKRSKSKNSRFSIEPDEEKALDERRHCLSMSGLTDKLDIPPEVLESLSEDELLNLVNKKLKDKKSGQAGSSSSCSCSCSCSQGKDKCEDSGSSPGSCSCCG